jgi:hypothetical protein
MPIAGQKTVITPPPTTSVGEPDVAGIVTITPTIVVTETKVIDTELINDGNPWRDTQAVRDATTLTEPLGRPWPVDYLKSAAGNGDIPDVSSVSTSYANQQFIEYRDLVLKVTQGLVPETNPETQVVTIIGAATLVDVLIPTQGDHIIARLDEGRTVTLVVTRVTSPGIYKGRAYNIEYKAIDISPDDLVVIRTKITHTFHCVQLNRSDSTVALTSAAIGKLNAAKRRLDMLESAYVSDFYNERAYTFTLKLGESIHHDPLTVTLVRAMIDKLPYVENYVDLSRIRTDIYNDLLILRISPKPSPDLVKNMILGATLVSARLNTINYVGINTVAKVNAEIIHTEYLTTLNSAWEASLAAESNILPNPSTHSSYLVPEKWWLAENMSTLEQEMWAFINGKPSSEDSIVKLIETMETVATEHERYYFAPIVMLLGVSHYVKHGSR